ncbi:MAG: GNAT family N-acetyltransferase [Roseivirga sp.]
MEIRRGTKADLPQALELIRELALYEKAPEQVDNSVERMEADGFGDNPVFEFFVADEQGDIKGIAIYYYRYSTWKGKSIYLEDLVVRESERGSGIGKLLLDAVVLEARATDSRQVTWQVLDWNEPAINFYKKLGAELDGEWINCRLNHEQILNYKA